MALDPPIIRLKATGGLGNRMFICLFAYRLACEMPGAVITGDGLREWGLQHPDIALPLPSMSLQGHRPDLTGIVSLFRQGLLRGLETNCLSCRMDLLPPRAIAAVLFRRGAELALRVGPDDLLINIRAAEILGARHEDYRPLPIAWYARLIEQTGLRPVFMGQIADDPYSAALRQRFPQAAFHESQGPMADFATIRAARHIVLPVSTFSWLAAWLSQATCIHLPIIGFFHPRRRPDVDLLPVGDARYRFHLFRHTAWTGTEAELQTVIAGPEAGTEVPPADVVAITHRILG